MDYLPVSIKLKKQTVLLVGAGKVASRKARTLLKAGARLRLVAPERDVSFDRELGAYFKSGDIDFVERVFAPEDLEGVVLVIAATNDLAVNRLVSQKAQERALPVNVVDQPGLSTLIFPSIVDRDPITIAVSTAGRAPVLARLLRARLETLVPSYYGDLASLVDNYRQEVKKLLPDISQRKAFWEQVLQGSISEHMMSKRVALAEKGIKRLLAQLKSGEKKTVYEGEVYLVGAGPGDPDLLTFKALRLLQQSDVVLYDRLVSDEVVDLARKDAEKIYVGKSRKHHTLVQEDINTLLIKHARAGKRVCRLKGGDPFIFGRGGEEIEKLSDAGISFQVVPGITAAAGCASYAGIPLTHRDYSQSVIFVTGHRKTDPRFQINWRSLAEPDQTLVFYMGLHEIHNITVNLLDAGLSAITPAAVIQQGTTSNQRVVEAPLGELADTVAAAGLVAPTLIVVGEVVRLRDKLDWFSG